MPKVYFGILAKILPPFKKRVKSVFRPAHEAELIDILISFKVLITVTPIPIFVAKDLNRVPKHGHLKNLIL